jgi:hypothetical protein
VPIGIVAAAQLSSSKAAQLSLKTQPKHSPSTHTEGRQTSLSSRPPPVTKQASKTVNTTSTSQNATTLGTGDRRSMPPKSSRSLDVCGMAAGQAHSRVRIATDRHKAQTSMEQATKHNTTTERLSCKLATILLLSSTAVNSTLQLLRACRPAGSSPVYCQSKSTEQHNCRVVRITRRHQHCSSLHGSRLLAQQNFPYIHPWCDYQPNIHGETATCIHGATGTALLSKPAANKVVPYNILLRLRPHLDRNRIQMPIVQCSGLLYRPFHSPRPYCDLQITGRTPMPRPSNDQRSSSN